MATVSPSKEGSEPVRSKREFKVFYVTHLKNHLNSLLSVEFSVEAFVACRIISVALNRSVMAGEPEPDLPQNLGADFREVQRMVLEVVTCLLRLLRQSAAQFPSTKSLNAAREVEGVLYTVLAGLEQSNQKESYESTN